MTYTLNVLNAIEIRSNICKTGYCVTKAVGDIAKFQLAYASCSFSV